MSGSQGILRQALRSDIAAIQRVRHSVHENKLTSTVISDAEVQRHLEKFGRGWVIEVDGTVVAFAIARTTDGNIWGLFVDPEHERRGYGRRLHDAMVGWLWTQRLERLWLTTTPATRAEGFYKMAGWTLVGDAPHGEVRFEMRRP
jgi:GNAT superfamily N-acetyltransferase